MGKDWAGPFFPPSLIFRSSIDRFVFRFMLLFHSILTFMKDLYQSEYQVFNPTRLLVLLHCWVGKELAGPFFPPSKIFRSFYWSVTIVVFRFMLLFHCILTLMNDRFQRENQVFKPKSLLVISLQCVPTFVFYLSELILPNSGLGKDWVDFPLTHSNNHFELRTYSFCFLNRLTIYNQILLHPLHFCAVLRVVEL